VTESTDGQGAAAPYTFIAKDGQRIPASGLGELYGLFVEHGNTPLEALALCAKLVSKSLHGERS
jgi:hypothetical protein